MQAGFGRSGTGGVGSVRTAAGVTEPSADRGDPMAVPKKKTSRHRKGKRRSHHHLAMPHLSRCSRCGKACRAHAICDACGYYAGKAVLVDVGDESSTS